MVRIKEPPGYNLNRGTSVDVSGWVVVGTLITVAGFFLRLGQVAYWSERGWYARFQYVIEANTLQMAWIALPWVMILAGGLVCVVLGSIRKHTVQCLLGAGLTVLACILVLFVV